MFASIFVFGFGFIFAQIPSHLMSSENLSLDFLTTSFVLFKILQILKPIPYTTESRQCEKYHILQLLIDSGFESDIIQNPFSS